MFKKIVLSLIAIMGIALSAYAQKQVSGKVVDAQGQPLPGVSVFVAGTNVGTVTDSQGAYSLNVRDGKELKFAFFGMKDVSVPVEGKSVIDVKMEDDNLVLNEVVVTALGITKSEKTLGYAATTVKTEEITRSRTTDPVSALAGKVAGVQISQSSTTAGSQQSVIIRGISSISGNNQPLYVIDGVPLAAVTVSNTNDSYSGNVGAGIGSVNPDDIESMTVLKGAAATALYGSRASGGVIVITTKGNKNNVRTQIDVNAGVQFSQVANLPEFQNSFGTGWDGNWTKDENGSWGPRFNGLLRPYGPVVNNEQMIKDYKAIPNNIKDFFETGVQYNTGISITGGNDKTTFYGSFNRTKDDGILPGSKDTYAKNTVALRGSHQAFSWLKIGGNMNFTTQKTSQVTQSSSTDSMIEGLYQSGRDISFIDMQDLSNKFNTPEGYFTPYSVINPYWLIETAHNTVDMKKIFGKLEADITPMRQLKFTYRFGFDYTDFEKKLTKPTINVDSDNPNSALNQEGSIYEQFQRRNELNHDFLANWSDKYFNDKFDVNVTLGANINQRSYSYMYGEVTGLTFDNWWDISNTPNNPTSLAEQQLLRRSAAIFGDVTLGWDDQFYLNLCARNDWSSTLPLGKNSFFYPGATLSWLITNTFGTGAVSYAKARVAYGKTGNDPEAYVTNAAFEKAESRTIYGVSTKMSFPFAGYNGYYLSGTLASSTLQPEMTTEFEIGGDIRFLDNRIGLDATYYNRVSDMQIFQLPVDRATGYQKMTMNLGKIRNQGIELMLSTTPIRTKDWRWDIDLNWSKNFNKVESLPDGLEGGKSYITGDGWGKVEMYAEIGKPIGQLYANLPQYTEDGKIIVNSDGLPVQGTELEYTGYDVNNKWVGGINTRLSYKGFSVAATFDFHVGGKMVSRTKSILWFTGNSIETTYNDRKDFIIPNSVVWDETAKAYVENTTPITMDAGTFQYFYDGNYSYPLEGGACNLVDRSYAKLRNLTVSYDFPKKWFGKSFVKGVLVSAVGNNLFTWTPASNCYIDPDQGYTTDLKGMLGEYFCTVSNRYMGFNVKVTF